MIRIHWWYPLGPVLALALAAACNDSSTPATVATQLAFSVQPGTTRAGDAISPAVQVEVRDAGGTVVPGARDPVTLAVFDNADIGTLAGTTSVNAVNGIATFTGLSINTAAAGYTLFVWSGSLGTATSAKFNITPGPAARLAFVQQPGGGSGGPLGPLPTQVVIRDRLGNLANTATNIVTMSLSPSPAYGGLTGTSSAAAVGGVATFPSLRIVAPGTYTLRATADPLDAATSSSFTVHLQFTDLGAGGNHTCGVTTLRAIYCWGGNATGQLGNGTTVRSEIPVLVLATGVQFSRVSAGGNDRFAHTCGLTEVGNVYCWGSNENGEVGDLSTNRPSLTPTFASGRLFFTTISAGGYDSGSHTCGISGGHAFCWGLNDRGQLGDGTTTSHAVPTPVSGGLDFDSISAGGGHTCALTPAGAAWCWGNNGHEQIGDATYTDRSVPTPVSGGLTFVQVKAGRDHTCGLTAAGAAYCWGVLPTSGGGTPGESGVPVPVTGGLTFVLLSTGANASHTCAATLSVIAPAPNNAFVGYCWGFNLYGAIGDGTATVRPAPTQVFGPLFVQLTTGSWHTCGRTSTGDAYCWGYGGDGQVGNGTTGNSYTPNPVLQ